MGTGIIGLIIGLLLGIGIAYWVLQQRLEEQEKEFQSRLQQRQEELEQDRERRTRAAVQVVQEDLQRQLRAKEEELNRVVATREQDRENFSSRQTATQTRNEETVIPENLPNLITPSPSPETELQNSSELSEEAIDRDSSPHLIVPSNPPETELQDSPQLPQETAEWENSTNITTSAKFTDVELEKSLQPPEKGAYQNSSPNLISSEVNTNTELQKASIISETEANEEVFAERKIVNSKEKKAANFRRAELNSKQKIIAWGDGRLLIYIPQLLQYLRYPAAEIREGVATALGKICEGKMLRAEVEKAILALGMLANDSEVSVRKQAIESLGKIKSEKIIPFLIEGLRDADRDVVKLASSTLQQFKSYPIKRKAKIWVKREIKTDSPSSNAKP